MGCGWKWVWFKFSMCSLLCTICAYGGARLYSLLSWLVGSPIPVKLTLVRSVYSCRVTVCWVCIVGLAGFNKVWLGYTWCVCQYLDNQWVDLSDMWWKCLEWVTVACDGVWQEVGVVLIFYMFCTMYNFFMRSNEVVLASVEFGSLG